MSHPVTGERQDGWLEALERVYDFVPLARYDDVTKLAEYAVGEMFKQIEYLHRECSRLADELGETGDQLAAAQKEIERLNEALDLAETFVETETPTGLESSLEITRLRAAAHEDRERDDFGKQADRIAEAVSERDRRVPHSSVVVLAVEYRTLAARLADAQKENERLRGLYEPMSLRRAAAHEDRERPCEHGIAFGEFCPRCPGGGV